MNELDLDTFENDLDTDQDAYSYKTRGLARELIPNELLAEEWYSRGQRDLDTILELL